ncbi:hypothetical protein ACLOJK_023850 [Asimina triloba]
MGENRFGIKNCGLNEWVITFESNKAKDQEPWEKHSIYILPRGYVDPKRSQAYKPQIVSFGPYHHGHDELRPMEEHKHRALHHFLARTRKPLHLYAAALEQEAQKLMDSYKDLDQGWKDLGRFLPLMILDGCFMRELLRTSEGDFTESDYSFHDPIFSKHAIISIMPRIRRDMLMIENQIPLLVLKTLLTNVDQVVNELVLGFYSIRAPEPVEGLGLHVLDVVRKSMVVHRPNRVRQIIPPGSTMDVIWPATELEEAGISFETSRSNSLTDIDFKNGILWLPQIIIDDATESKFLNMIALEHLHMGSENEVSSYVAFMDNMIDTDKDVKLLAKSMIIKNFVGTDQAVADLFNGLAHDASIHPDSHLSSVHHQVTAYCENEWNKYLAYLRHNYFKNPWSFISFLAGILAVCLSITSFIYATVNFIERHR